MGNPLRIRTALRKPTAPAARSGRGQGQDFFSGVGLDEDDFLAIIRN